MGSLMAGWSSPTKDIKSEKLERNRSLTKEEIETYWKSKKRTEEDHLSDISDHVLDENKENLLGSVGAADSLKKSFSFPLGGRNKNSVVCSDANTSNCWWTRSNWAFLNEPPVKAMEGPSYKYAACRYRQSQNGE